MIETIVYYFVVGLPVLFVLLSLVLLIQRILPASFPLGWVRFLTILIGLIYVVGLFHYTLPQRDIVRITKSEIIRMDFSGNNRVFYAQADSGSAESFNRDLRLINTVDGNGKIRVYRNEDTGLFGWPPYFKINSSNMQAQADDLVSTRDAPRWVALRHYGWRSELISIYPNAVSMKEVSGPNVRLIPWFNIVFFVVLALVVLFIYRRIQRFKRRRVDPMLDRVDDTFDDIGAHRRSIGDRVRGMFKRIGGAE